MKRTIYIFAFLPLLFILGCVEPYALQTKNFDDALVIEATITNEFKTQEIRISHTFRFEDDAPATEEGPQVVVTDDTGNSYDFELSDSTYKSTTPFQAQPDRSYSLSIVTANGRAYNSTTEKLPAVNPMQELKPKTTIKENVPGVEIVVSSFDPTGSSRYYRYEYEETQKIVVPYAATLNATFIQGGTIGENTWEVTPRTSDVSTCYSTSRNTSIIQTTTMGMAEDRLSEFPVRFISDVDPIIRERYSIKVRQYVQNFSAYSFYKTMKDLSSSGSVLSQNQPGFFYGNISNLENPGERVIGFFDVSSVSEQRIFFNFHDIFPGQALPPYAFQCDLYGPLLAYQFCLGPPPCDGWYVMNALTSNQLILYQEDNFHENQLDFEWLLVKPECGDCTTFSSHIVPSFWQD